MVWTVWWSVHRASTVTNKECVNGVTQTVAKIPTVMNRASVRDPAVILALVAALSALAYCSTTRTALVAPNVLTEHWSTAKRVSTFSEEQFRFRPTRPEDSNTGEWWVILTVVVIVHLYDHSRNNAVSDRRLFARTFRGILSVLKALILFRSLYSFPKFINA